MKHELFPLDDLPPGELRAVDVAGTSIVILRTADGDLHAVRNRCPHAGAQLARGLLERAVVGDDVGEYSFSDDILIRCPWHGWEFDVTTGRCLADPKRTRVRVYPVEVVDGVIVVER